MDAADTIRKLLRLIGEAPSPIERRRLTRRLVRTMDLAPNERDRFFSGFRQPTPAQGRFLLGLARRLTFPWSESLTADVVGILLRPEQSRRRRTLVARRLMKSPHAGAIDSDRIISALTEGLTPDDTQKFLAAFGHARPPREPRVKCPRCAQKLPARALADHMIEAHRLVLEDGRATDAWTAMRGWSAKFRAEQDPETLDRATELARRLDGSDGLERLARLVSSRALPFGDRNSETPNAATVCPRCYKEIEPPADFDPPKAVVLSRDLEVGWFSIRRRGNNLIISDQDRPTASVRIISPPSRPGISKVVWAVLGLSLVAAFAWPADLGPPPFAASAVLLSLASLVYWLGNRGSAKADGPGEMAGLAWNYLAPMLARAEPSWETFGALAGLAAFPDPAGPPRERLALLEGMTPAFRRAAVAGTIPASWLVPASALEIADLERTGGDPVPRLARAVGLCWSGQVPLLAAEGLLAGAGFENYSRPGRARLRVLLLRAAFEAGLYPNDVQELGRAVPGLGEAVANEDILGIARMRSLWNLERGGRAKELGAYWTCFDLAATPSAGATFLEEEPNLLMVQPSNEWFEAYPEIEAIRATEEGVFCGLFSLTSLRTNIRVKNVGVMSGGYELVVGDQTGRVRSDPQWIVGRLRAWQAYVFGKVLGGANEQMRGEGSAPMARLMAQVQADCPECGTRLLRQPGGVGIPVVRTD